MRRVALSCIALQMFVASCARAAVLRVPEEYPSVLAAVDAAVGGDSVLVGPGVWAEREARVINIGGNLLNILSVAFLKPGISVVGTAGPGATVLDGGVEAGTAVLTLSHYIGGSDTTRIVGVTITGGGDAIGAVEASPLRLANCRLVGNSRAAFSARDQSLTLTDCEVSDNEWGSNPPYDGAIDGFDVDLECVRTTFERNAGPGIWTDGDRLVLRECYFGDHQTRGAVLRLYDELEIESSVFLRNSIPGGGGGALSISESSGSIRFCTFAFDSSGNGGAVELTGGSSVRVESNTFYGCYAWFAGSALSAGLTDAGVLNNIFAKCSGPRGTVRGGGSMHPDTGCNLFWENEAPDYFDAWAPRPTDVHGDPLFCDEAVGDYHLMSSSPAAPENSECGLIGAFDVGCGVVSVEAESWGRIKNLYRGMP